MQEATAEGRSCSVTAARPYGVRSTALWIALGPNRQRCRSAASCPELRIDRSRPMDPGQLSGVQTETVGWCTWIGYLNFGPRSCTKPTRGFLQSFIGSRRPGPSCGRHFGNCLSFIKYIKLEDILYYFLEFREFRALNWGYTP